MVRQAENEQHILKTIQYASANFPEKYGRKARDSVSLYVDTFEQERIVTYREKEHNLLMDIRNGKYLDENLQPVPAFYELLDGLERRMDYDKENTSHPDHPDDKRIRDFVEAVNERVVKNTR